VNVGKMCAAGQNLRQMSSRREQWIAPPARRDCRLIPRWTPPRRCQSERFQQLSASRSLSLPCTKREHRRADGRGDPDVHEPEPQREREITFAGLEHNGCRHRPGVTGDVPANDKDGTHLGNRAPERGENGGKDAKPFDRKQVGDGAQRRGPVDQDRAGILIPSVVDGPMNERRHDRRS